MGERKRHKGLGEVKEGLVLFAIVIHSWRACEHVCLFCYDGVSSLQAFWMYRATDRQTDRTEQRHDDWNLSPELLLEQTDRISI